MDWGLLLSLGLPELLAAAGMLLLAAGLLRINFNAPVNRAFAFFLVVRAVGMVVATVSDLAADPREAAYWARISVYFVLALTPAMLYFAAVYPRPRRWLQPAGAAPAAFLLLVVLEGLYIADHALCCTFASNQGNIQATGPLVLGYGPFLFGSAVLAAVFARDYVAQPPGPSRHSLGLVVMAFGLTALYNAMLYLQLVWLPIGAWLQLLLALAYPAVGLVAFAALLLVRHALRTREGQATAQARLFLLLLPLPLLSGFAAISTTWPHEFLITGFWRMAFPVIVTYAILRHQLFDIDLKVKRTVKHGTLAATFIGLYVVVTLGAQGWGGGALGPYLSVGAAGLLLLAVLPLQRLADRVAAAALPGVSDAPGYLHAKRLEVYRATLERAVAQGGALTSREASMLATLRSDLGITERDHAVLEHALRASPGAARPSAMEPGQRFLGCYRVLRPLGEGGAGTSYLCRDERVRRDVVIKRLRSVLPTVEGLEAVHREARAIGALRHPNVVTLHDVEQLGAEAFIVMEYLDGGSLRERLGTGSLSAKAFARLADDTLAALEAVHEAGMVHRDVKPSNILLTGSGTAKLGDFGVAHIPGFETTAAGLGAGGAALGTIRYMSPEQARGHVPTARSDLFSAAATLYEAYTGAPYLAPRAGESPFELQVRAASAGVFDRRMPAPVPLRRWFARALHPDPAKRFASAAEMRSAFARVRPTG